MDDAEQLDEALDLLRRVRDEIHLDRNGYLRVRTIDGEWVELDEEWVELVSDIDEMLEDE